MKLFSAVTLGSLLSVEAFSPIQGHRHASATTTALNVALDREQAQQQVNGRSDPPSNDSDETPKATKHWPRTLPNLETAADNASSGVNGVDPSHFTPLGSWSPQQIAKSRQENPFVMAFGPGKSRHGLPTLTHGAGVYVYDDEGKQYLDWTSQAVCANLGHDVPPSVVDAVVQQMGLLPYTMGDLGFPEVRARMNQLMREVMPGTLGPAVFPSSGAEANEAAIAMARRYTGKSKIITWYRSYHGASGHAGAATGDCRRWFGSDKNPGFVKAFNPFPLFFGHAGETEPEQVQAALQMMEELILNEGPDQIACIMMESIMGAGGVLIMPPDYMRGIRALCDKYNILLHFDEVMVGFGRTGKMFGFENYEGVLPDIVSTAKGLSSAVLPVSMTACTQEIMDFFEDTPLGYGSTYQAHPVALACAYENVKYLLQNDIVGRVERLSTLFESEVKRLADAHPSIKQYRSIGLFGALDIQQKDGTIPKLQHEGGDAAFSAYRQAYAENGLMGLHRYPHIHCAPPLVINESELKDGFDRLHRALSVLDEALGF